MKTIINHEKYGEICYEESNFLGKKSLKINGVPLKQLTKKSFEYQENGESHIFNLKGNSTFGASLEVNGEQFTLIPKTAWYVFTFAIVVSVFLFVWGNSLSLTRALFPIVGGAIGGAFIGVTFVLYLYFTKKCKKVWQQMLVCVAIAIIEVLLLALLALAFIEIVRA